METSRLPLRTPYDPRIPLPIVSPKQQKKYCEQKKLSSFCSMTLMLCFIAGLRISCSRPGHVRRRQPTINTQGAERKKKEISAEEQKEDMNPRSFFHVFMCPGDEIMNRTDKNLKAAVRI